MMHWCRTTQCCDALAGPVRLVIPGTHNLIRVALRFRAAFLWLQGTPRHFSQTRDKALVSHR
jgi:hypothetical protein